MARTTQGAQARTANNNNNNSQQQQQPPPAQPGTGMGTAGAQQQPPPAQLMQPYINMVWDGQLPVVQGTVAKKCAETAVAEQWMRKQELFEFLDNHTSSLVELNAETQHVATLRNLPNSNWVKRHWRNHSNKQQTTCNVRRGRQNAGHTRGNMPARHNRHQAYSAVPNG
eukprot:3247494-Ditylum_brightwellii.AAC.1